MQVYRNTIAQRLTFSFATQELRPQILEEEVRTRPRLHTMKDAKKVIRLLEDAGAHCHLVGSLGMGYPSAHDIDVLFCESEIAFKPTNATFIELFKPTLYAFTNHNSIYLRHTKVGGADVEIFFQSILERERTK